MTVSLCDCTVKTGAQHRWLGLCYVTEYPVCKFNACNRNINLQTSPEASKLHFYMRKRKKELWACLGAVRHDTHETALQSVTFGVACGVTFASIVYN